MPYRISRLGGGEIRGLGLDCDLEHYVLGLHLSGGEDVS